MNILVILIPASLILAVAALAAFIWTIRSNQYDDLSGVSHRIFLEDERATDSDGVANPAALNAGRSAER